MHQFSFERLNVGNAAANSANRFIKSQKDFQLTNGSAQHSKSDGQHFPSLAIWQKAAADTNRLKRLATRKSLMAA